MTCSTPHIQMDPTELSSNCIFCLTDISNHRAGKNVSAIIHLDLVIHRPSAALPWTSVLSQLKRENTFSEENRNSEEEEASDSDYRVDAEEKKHNTPSKKTSVARSEILVSQRQIPSFSCRETSAGIC